MRLPRSAAAWAAVLLLMPIAAADWSQEGGDAGRSGFMRDGGPAWDEVALEIPAPENEEWSPWGQPAEVENRAVTPLIIGREAIAPTSRAIYAASLDTGEVRKLADLALTHVNGGGAVLDWASDGEGLFVVESLVPTLRIIPIRGGEEQSIPIFGTGDPVNCRVAVRELVYVACLLIQPASRTDVAGQTNLGVLGNAYHPRLVIEAHQPGGTLVWSWERDADPKVAQEESDPTSTRDPVLEQLVGLSVVEDQLIPVTSSGAFRPQANPDAPNAANAYYWDGWVLNASRGGLYYPSNSAQTAFTGRSSNHFGWKLGPHPPTRYAPTPVVGDDSTQVRFGPRFFPTADQPPDVTLLARGAIVAQFAYDGVDSPTRPALGPSLIVLPEGAALIAVDRSGRFVWRSELGIPASTRVSPLIDSESIFVMTGNDQASPSLAAFELATGEARWSHAFSGAVNAIAGGNGVLVAAVSPTGNTSLLTVMGRTAASIPVRAEVSQAYPKAAELIRVDLSGSGTGLKGSATRFRAEWGDGERTGWQDSPILEHGYITVGDHTAHVFAGNEAGQISSQAVEFHVGRSPPQNFLQDQFSDANQNRTFFLLGLAITGLAALFGFARIQRRRNILARELRDLDHAVKATPADPTALDRVLDDRRLRARALLLGGKLDENQHAVLAARVEELSRAVRLDMVHQRLDFLPFRHVRALREMLQDGRITSLERAHYLAMLDGDSTLTPDYKARVRAVVDEWATHDSGAGS